MRFIDVDEIVALTQMALGLETADFTPQLRRWSFDAQRRIGVGYGNIKDKCEEIKDLMFDKPCDLLCTNEIYLTTATVITGDTKWTAAQYTSNPRLLKQQFRPTSSLPLVTDISQGDNYTLDSQSGQFKTAKIYYYGVPTNENNEPLIPDMNQDAIVAFNEYMYNKMLRNQGKQVPLSTIQDCRMTWINLKKRAYGNQNKVDKIKMSEVAYRFLRIVPGRDRIFGNVNPGINNP